MNNWFNNRILLLICGVLGMLAVGLGAFGAHGLKDVLPAEKLTTYTTGISYHFYHTISLLGVVILMHFRPSKWFKSAALLFIVGIIFFSGSLYLLATRELIGLVNYKWLGPITPIGGLLFIIGWLCICIGSFDDKDSNAAN